MRAILIGGSVAGVLDILDAFIFSYLRSGVPPGRVLQAVASGVLGRPAFQGGAGTAALGLAIHFAIATTVAAIYVVASRRMPILIRHAAVAGMAYGLAVYVVMHQVVLPLSNFRGGPFSWPSFINGVLIHALGVGMPIALIARRGGAP